MNDVNQPPLAPLRHFLSLLDLSSAELYAVIDRARELKTLHARGIAVETLKGRVLAMIFEKASTRTRVSFEAGMHQLGGHAMFLSPRDMQLGRGEPLEDSARVVSSMVDAIMLRTHGHDRVASFAAYSRVPVINGLSDRDHPCQLLADLQTWFEVRGDIKGARVAWVGDGNNMCNAYINAARLLDFELRIAVPEGYEPDATLVAAAGSRISLTHDPVAAVTDADLVVTDVWASMGQEDEQHARLRDFDGFQVNETLLEKAGREALFMHCLPAHRGEEVSAEVIDGWRSLVWQEAENRLHAQKALLEFLIVGLPG